jgi:hypothetical protein
MVKEVSLNFDDWLAYGVANGFCSEQVCEIHQGTPMTETEVELFDEGCDPCQHVVRLGTPEEWEEDALAYKENTSE